MTGRSLVALNYCQKFPLTSADVGGGPRINTRDRSQQTWILDLRIKIGHIFFQVKKKVFYFKAKVTSERKKIACLFSDTKGGSIKSM